MSLTLDDVRNVPIEELHPTDISVLKEHKDDLTDEEKERFSSFLVDKPKEEVKETPKEETPSVETPKEETPDPGDHAEPKEEPKETPKETPEEKVTLTKAELEALIQEKVKAAIPQPKDEPKVETPKEETPFIPEDWSPDSWMDVFKKGADYFKNMSAKEKAEAQKSLDEINAGFTKEIDDLRTAGEPIPAAGTPEYVKFDRELTATAMKYQIPSFKSAYEVYKVLPKETPKETPKVEPKKEVNKENKEVAKNIGGITREVSNKPKPIDYKIIRGKTPRQIADMHADDDE